MSNISHIISQEGSGSSAPLFATDTENNNNITAAATDHHHNGTDNGDDNDNDNDHDNDNMVSDPKEADDESQRKRSKVSRACDECRRKKIKCDAVLTSSNALEKACTSCIKNNDQCLFERVPLKRGPTKGFSSSNRSRSNSRSSRHDSISSIHSVQSTSSQQIILPPLTSLTVPIDNQPGLSSPSSPRRLSINSQPQQQPLPSSQHLDFNNVNSIQQQSGLFWKVPSSFNRRGSNVSIDSNVSNDRFSVSSSSSNFKPQFKTKSYESSVISDSEDDNRMLLSASPNLNSLRVGLSSNNGTLPVDGRGQAILLENYYKIAHPICPILIERDQLSELLQYLEMNDINHVLVNFLYHALDFFLADVKDGEKANLIMSINQSYWKIFQLYQSYQDYLQKSLASLYLYLTSLVILNTKLFNLRDFESINLNFTNIIFKKFKIFSKYWNTSTTTDSPNKNIAVHLKISYFNICYLNALTSLAINSERDGLNIVRFDFKPENKEESLLPPFPRFLLNFNCFKQSIFKDFNYNKESIYNNYISLIQGFLNDDAYTQIFDGGSGSNNNLDGSFFKLIKLNYELLYKIDTILKTQRSSEVLLNSKSDLVSFIDQSQFQLYDTLNQQLAVLKSIVPVVINGGISTKPNEQQHTLLKYSSSSNLFLSKAIDLIKLQQIFLNVFKINSQLSFKISMNFNDLINLIQIIPNFNAPKKSFESNSLQFFVSLTLPNTLSNLDLNLVQMIYHNYSDLLKNLYVDLLEKDLRYGWVSA